MYLISSLLKSQKCLSTIFTFLLLSGLFLAGCSPSAAPIPTATASATQTPIPRPSPTAENCLIGIWEIKDPETFLRASVPAGAFDPETMDFVGSVGSVAYRFDVRNVVTVEAVSFQGRFDVKSEQDLSVLDIRMIGFTSGSYDLKGNTLNFLDMLSSDMTFEVFYQKEYMMDNARADSFLPLFVEPYRTANITCSQDALSLELINFPNIQEPIEFKRLR